MPRRRFGLVPVRSPLLGESCLLSLPAGTKMFQFPAFASMILMDDGIASAGLPHSDIRGSMGICPSPRLFAACHVLRRLREPRHPPYALSNFVVSSFPLPWDRNLRNSRLWVFGIFTRLLVFVLCLVARLGKDRSSLRLARDFYSFASSMSMSSSLMCPHPVSPACGSFLSVVENNGFEPLTPCLQSRRSSQLS